MKVLGITKSKIAKNDNGDNVETTEIVLVHCVIAHNDYQQNSRVQYAFVSN